MLTMSQINHIKDLSNCGYRISEISKKTGADPKTIRKYLAQDDFSPQPPIIQEKPSKLDPFKPSSANGWMKTRNIGASSIIPHKEFMSVLWRNMAIPEVTALSNAI